LGGYFALLMWALIHILFLIDFRRRLVVFVEWTWLSFTGDGRRPKAIQTPSDFLVAAGSRRPRRC